MCENVQKTSDYITENLLSAEQLFCHRKPSEKSLPKSGVKDYCPDGSVSHQRRLEIHREEQGALLSEQHVDKIGNLVKGLWNPERDLVELEKELGKFWAYMGFVDHKRKWLYPEEALFLMETSVLEVWYGESPISIQQGYSGLLGRAVSYHEYQVYAHLRRLGFVVVRHSGRAGATRYERKIRLDQHVERKRRLADKQPGPSKQVKVEDNTSAEDSLNVATADDPNMTAVNSTAMATPEGTTVPATGKSSFMSDHGLTEGEITPLIQSQPDRQSSLPDVSATVSKTSQAHQCESDEASEALIFDSRLVCEKDIDKHLPPKPRLVDFSHIDIPCMYGKADLTLRPPNSGLLPPEVNYSKDNYEFNVKTFPLSVAKVKERKYKTVLLDYEVDSSLEYSFPQFMADSVNNQIKAENWQDYKAKKRQLNRELSCLGSSPASVLWAGDVTPLVTAKDADCTASILQKLKVIGELRVKPAVQSMEEKNPIRIVFDVYQPDSRFRKSTPGTPHFRIFVQDHNEDPPSLSHIVEAANRLHDDVTLLCAVIDCGDIALYNFTPLSLPVDISVG